jgi:hypothetical protein
VHEKHKTEVNKVYTRHPKQLALGLTSQGRRSYI